MTTSIPPVEENLVFLEETDTSEISSATGASNLWRILIVDDDADVHSATVFALGNLEIQSRPLEFLHAYSAEEARTILQSEREVAVILLDVVMEHEDAGLKLVRTIRETLSMTEVRIILRTGQPGYAPELDAIRDYDINDYKTKSELTRIKLFTTVTSAIRSYEQICAINSNRRGLDLIVRASTELMTLHGLQNFAADVITQISGLLNLKAEGLICVRENHDDQDGELFVIAAAGDYKGFVNKPIAAAGNARIAAALVAAFAARRNIYAQDYSTLFFVGQAGHDFAAFLNTGMPLSEIDQRLLEVFCSNISVGLDNVMLIARLHDFAYYDSLSKLPNRTRLVEILNTTLTNTDNKKTTLALVDIDHFSETNDALGHQFGDALLLAVADRLQSQSDNNLTVARVASDAFALLGTAEQVNPLMILSQFEKAFSIDGQQVQLSATAGLVRLQEYEGDGADALKDAEIALKRAKLQQRGGHFYFTKSMAVDIRERVRMMYALRAAFEQTVLFVVYQPQVDLVTRRVTGAEALLRWKADDGNFIPPDRFIPIAEYSGLIVDLGEWVMRNACRELVRIHALGLTDFMMSINVSQVQFRHPHFLDMLNQALHDTGAPPQFIELEITESMAMEEPDALIHLLTQIKKTGVSIAIDDFGTGFSSLNYLQQLHVDRLKIDRAFVSEITNSSRGSSIAEMVIQLGRNLDLTVIAEGVENELQAAILSALGCPLAQGYLFAKPMTSDSLTTWLESDGHR